MDLGRQKFLLIHMFLFNTHSLTLVAHLLDGSSRRHGVAAVDFQHILRSVLFNYVTDLQILSD
jgi:hypothetical protein